MVDKRPGVFTTTTFRLSVLLDAVTGGGFLSGVPLSLHVFWLLILGTVMAAPGRSSRSFVLMVSLTSYWWSRSFSKILRSRPNDCLALGAMPIAETLY